LLLLVLATAAIIRMHSRHYRETLYIHVAIILMQRERELLYVFEVTTISG
jgi:hypothetical protein